MKNTGRYLLFVTKHGRADMTITHDATHAASQFSALCDLFLPLGFVVTMIYQEA